MRALLTVLLFMVAVHAAPVPKGTPDSLAEVRNKIEAELDALDKPQAKAMATLRYAIALHEVGETKAAKVWFSLVKMPPFNPERHYEHSMYILVAVKVGEFEKAEAVYVAGESQLQDVMQRVFRFGYVQALLNADKAERAGELLRSEQSDKLGIKFHVLHAAAVLITTKDVNAGAKALNALGLAEKSAGFWCAPVDMHMLAKDATKATECREKAFTLVTQRMAGRPKDTEYLDFRALCDLVRHAEHRSAVIDHVAGLKTSWVSKATKSADLAEALHRHRAWAEIPPLAEDIVQGGDLERFTPLLFDAYLHLNQPEKADELLKTQQSPLQAVLAYQRCLYSVAKGKLDDARKSMAIADEIGIDAKTLADKARTGGHNDSVALRKRQVARTLLEGGATAVADLDEVSAGIRLSILLDVLRDASQVRMGKQR